MLVFMRSSPPLCLKRLRKVPSVAGDGQRVDEILCKRAEMICFQHLRRHSRRYHFFSGQI